MAEILDSKAVIVPLMQILRPIYRHQFILSLDQEDTVGFRIRVVGLKVQPAIKRKKLSTVCG